MALELDAELVPVDIVQHVGDVADLVEHDRRVVHVEILHGAGEGEPLMAAIQALRKPGHDETPFSFDLSLSAYPRPPASLCVSRASAVGPVSDLSAVEVWTRPKLKKVKSPVLVADQASIGIFNTASLDVNDHNSLQRYELHVRLLHLLQRWELMRAAQQQHGEAVQIV